MSNPGVIKLAEDKINGQRFVIEDNIGETMHIHYGNIRLDLTIDEFYGLSKMAGVALKELKDIPELSIENMDIELLEYISGTIKDLVKVEHCVENLEKLFVVLPEENFLPMEFEKACEKYGMKEKTDGEVVLFNHDDYIISGFGKAIHHKNNGTKEIPVTRYFFKDEKNVVGEIEAQLQRYKVCEKLIKERMEKIPKNAKIAFRGGGKHMDEFMQFMPNDREIVCVIEKNATQNFDLKNRKIIPLSQMHEVEFDTVIISSFGFRKEMKKEFIDFDGEVIDFYDIFEKKGYSLSKPYYMMKVFGKWRDIEKGGNLT